ncbi:hypothetical protein OROMI_001287 [Orobanche minor]
MSGSTQRSIFVNSIDLNNDPVDEICELENGGRALSNELEDIVSNRNSFEPFVGQCFLSEQEAHQFYENYAKRTGFSIRRGRFSTKNGKIIRRDFFCHREGFPEEKILERSKEQRNRQSSRYGCKVVLRITLKKAYDIFPEEWHVTQFNSHHTHELLPPALVRFLPSYRTISDDDKQQILLYKEAGLSVKQIMRVMELQKNWYWRDILEHDAINLLENYKAANIDNPNFQFDYTVDEFGRLENIFWSPAHCFDMYQEYGDSTGFDTTCRVNSYDMPFGIFIGIDNYGRTVLFGCALLRNESRATFCWLMKTFLRLMKKPPKTITIDQDKWMTQAITKEMPYTKHAFCIWHITSKFSCWFTALLRNQYSQRCAEFYRLYRMDNIDDFEREWPIVVSKFNLQENKYVTSLYEIKRNWVPTYLRAHFFGGMTTTGRCESINSFVKRFTSSRSCLTQLIKQIDLAVENVEQTQLYHTMLVTYRGSSLRTLSPLEEQVHKLFTPFAFKKFQQEFERATQYTIREEDYMIYVVQHYKDLSTTQKHTVTWKEDAINCSCKLFEFWGILCRHILSVFLHKDYFEIPVRYLLVRWCRDEFHVKVIARETTQRMLNCDDMGHGAINLDEVDHIGNPPILKTKGRPKFKRQIGGKEASLKKVRVCSFCKESGHNITTCPQKENAPENTIPTSLAKKMKSSALISENLNPILLCKSVE